MRLLTAQILFLSEGANERVTNEGPGLGPGTRVSERLKSWTGKCRLVTCVHVRTRVRYESEWTAIPVAELFRGGLR